MSYDYSSVIFDLRQIDYRFDFITDTLRPRTSTGQFALQYKFEQFSTWCRQTKNQTKAHLKPSQHSIPSQKTALKINDNLACSQSYLSDVVLSVIQ